MAKPCVVLCAQNGLKAKALRCKDFGAAEFFQKVLRTSLTPQDKVFSTRFHYKIKRKGGEYDKCKVRLVVQGQHMKRKGADGVGDYDDAFSPVPAASGFRTNFSLAVAHDDERFSSARRLRNRGFRKEHVASRH